MRIIIIKKEKKKETKGKEKKTGRKSARFATRRRETNASWLRNMTFDRATEVNLLSKYGQGRKIDEWKHSERKFGKKFFFKK